jgi:hypothetical protein
VARDSASSKRKVQSRRKGLLEVDEVLRQQAKPVPQNGAQQPKGSDEMKWFWVAVLTIEMISL